MQPAHVIADLERRPAVPEGAGDRFSGYAVLGQTFVSGHVLALRRFPASSIGPGYTSVWHRDPGGAWTFYSTVVPEQGCSRYFGRAVTRDVVAEIAIEWLDATRFSVTVVDELVWTIELGESFAVRGLNAVARCVPESWWRAPRALRAMAAAARLLLGTGPLNLAGTTPNGQTFFANPRRLWLVSASRAAVVGRDLGAPGALPEQARLNDFLIPQRGLFAVACASLVPEREGS